MARFAVHAAMAGHTDTLVGLWNSRFIHVPIGTVARTSKKNGGRRDPLDKRLTGDRPTTMGGRDELSGIGTRCRHAAIFPATPMGGKVLG